MAKAWRDIPRDKVDKELADAVRDAADAMAEWCDATKQEAEVDGDPLLFVELMERQKAKAKSRGWQYGQIPLSAVFKLAFEEDTNEVKKLLPVLKARYGADFPLGVLTPPTPDVVAAGKATSDYWNKAEFIYGIRAAPVVGREILELNTAGVDTEAVEAIQALGERLTESDLAEGERREVTALLLGLRRTFHVFDYEGSTR